MQGRRYVTSASIRPGGAPGYRKSVPPKPAATARTESAAHEPTQQTATSERPILIVEDDAGMSTMLFIALEDANYAVRLAANGREALDQLNTVRPRLILLDLRMPVMDGLTFLQHLYAQPASNIPPVIVMTAYRDLEPSVMQFDLPSITKPMRLDHLMDMIKRYAELD